MHPILIGAWIACQALDLSTTQVALASGRFREGNPALAHARVPIKVGVNVLGFWAGHKMKSPAVKLALPISFTAAGCAAGAWNLHQMGRTQQ